MEELNKIMKNILLSKSNIRAQYKINKYELEHLIIKDDFKDILNIEINKLLVKEISKSTSPAKEIPTEDPTMYTYEKQLFVFEPQHFKLIVEACIQNMSEQQIKDIKDGKTRDDI